MDQAPTCSVRAQTGYGEMGEEHCDLRSAMACALKYMDNPDCICIDVRTSHVASDGERYPLRIPMHRCKDGSWAYGTGIDG